MISIVPAEVASFDLVEPKLLWGVPRLWAVLRDVDRFPVRVIPARTGGGELLSDPEEDSVAHRRRTEKDNLSDLEPIRV